MLSVECGLETEINMKVQSRDDKSTSDMVNLCLGHEFSRRSNEDREWLSTTGTHMGIEVAKDYDLRGENLLEHVVKHYLEAHNEYMYCGVTVTSSVNISKVEKVVIAIHAYQYNAQVSDFKDTGVPGAGVLPDIQTYTDIRVSAKKSWAGCAVSKPQGGGGRCLGEIGSLSVCPFDSSRQLSGYVLSPEYDHHLPVIPRLSLSFAPFPGGYGMRLRAPRSVKTELYLRRPTSAALFALEIHNNVIKAARPSVVIGRPP
ncbi:hypothetical protein EVAR_100101_1 [Eumeta japonica]|uniref:Uncharacterized protein n=1 Tax=Eumeta variegata TaxID=151549 RepID=A0A4C1YWV4_EUMVA|nr:hypothetical protein EVAR_100101_1 [Eumeta japonica]